MVAALCRLAPFNDLSKGSIMGAAYSNVLVARYNIQLQAISNKLNKNTKVNQQNADIDITVVCGNCSASMNVQSNYLTSQRNKIVPKNFVRFAYPEPTTGKCITCGTTTEFHANGVFYCGSGNCWWP